MTISQLFVLNLFIICAFSQYVSNRSKLELVQVLFRHGERTPSWVEHASLTTVDPSAYEPYGFEQLTNNGKSQVHEIGLMLRERYDSFLGSYEPDEVYAQSSDPTRMQMSALLALAGLYPPTNQSLWNQDLKWIPIPYTSVPQKWDKLFQSYFSEKFMQHFQKVLKSSWYAEKFAQFSDLLEFLKGKEGINDLSEMALVYNTLKSHRAMNITLPKWYSDKLLARLEEYVVFALDCMSLTLEMQKIVGGPFVKTFLQNILSSGRAIDGKKIYLYSGTELNIAAVVRALKINNFAYPDFASALILEKLRDSNNQVYVKLFGWDGVKKTIRNLKLGECDELCPIDDFLKISFKVIPSNEELNAL